MALTFLRPVVLPSPHWRMTSDLEQYMAISVPFCVLQVSLAVFKTKLSVRFAPTRGVA